MESGYTRTGGGLSRAGFRGGSVSPTYPPDGEATCPPMGDTILPLRRYVLYLVEYSINIDLVVVLCSSHDLGTTEYFVEYRS